MHNADLPSHAVRDNITDKHEHSFMIGHERNKLILSLKRKECHKFLKKIARHQLHT